MKKSSHSNTIEIDIEELNDDINSLIKKYSPSSMSNTLLTTDLVSNIDKGFYLVFIKRDDNAPLNQKLQTTIFGKHMNSLDIGVCFYNILQQLEKQNDTNNYA